MLENPGGSPYLGPLNYGSLAGVTDALDWTLILVHLLV